MESFGSAPIFTDSHFKDSEHRSSPAGGDHNSTSLRQVFPGCRYCGDAGEAWRVQGSDVIPQLGPTDVSFCSLNCMAAWVHRRAARDGITLWMLDG